MKLSIKTRFGIFMLIDSIIVLTAIFLSTLIIQPTMDVFLSQTLMISAAIMLITHHIFATMFHLYDRAWGVASIRELVVIAIAVTLTIIVTMIFQKFILGNVVIRVMFLTWLLHIIMIGGSRFVVRMWTDRDHLRMPSRKAKHVLIVGAGQGGTMLAKNLLHMDERELIPSAFIDDDIAKQNIRIHGVPVVGQLENLEQIIEKYHIDEIIIAIPSLTVKKRKKVVETCNATNLPVKIMPKIEDIFTGKLQVSDIREIEIEDLLGREPVQLDISGLQNILANETIMVTGAGGSIGSEICRQLSKFNPKRILLVGHGEFSIYTIYMELHKQYPEIEYLQIIGDVKDKRRMASIVEKYRPKIIYHAAAHKYVPIMEENGHEAIKNNVIGTRNVAEVARDYEVDTFVLISTDKAVNPTNVMGASKRVAEMIVQSLSRQESKTKFVAVRFGNVLGSRGSVIPLFTKQIRSGGPVTVTHRDMTRYFMTIPEASRLVIQAGSLARGGEIFVLDMGEQVKIVDLAKNMIKLLSNEEDGIEIKYTGLRKGEKMYEELLNEDEIHPEQIYEKIYIGKTTNVDIGVITRLTEEFHDLTQAQLKERLMEIVYEGKPELLEKIDA
ncbi:polysaccharide biosynthesis protein [Pseudogracilibacillus sp. ICA-222130]|uniref:polysaccharide biosynthesis protein n=1 Tax=Pseudogracilibacillus sp. ICA-222130 TaxID=3134655 RepID=UPI0030BE3DE5